MRGTERVLCPGAPRDPAGFQSQDSDHGEWKQGWVLEAVPEGCAGVGVGGVDGTTPSHFPDVISWEELTAAEPGEVLRSPLQSFSVAAGGPLVRTRTRPR